jgi:hypothetical protein
MIDLPASHQFWKREITSLIEDVDYLDEMTKPANQS